jgi:hypothetical protein
VARSSMWLAIWATVIGCQATVPITLTPLEGIETLLVVSIDGETPRVDAYPKGQPIHFALAADSSAFWAFGYRAPLARIGIEPGPVPLYPADEPSQPLPIAAESWIRDGQAMRPLEWDAVDPAVKALRIRLASREPCFEEGGCFLDAAASLCVECPIQAPPTPPARPRPARIPPCIEASDEASFACLFADRALEISSACAGLALPSGCVAAPTCGAHAEVGETIWVPPGPSVPPGATTGATLDEALRAIGEGGQVILGAGSFTASVAIPAGVQISGRCAEETELVGSLIATTATITHLRWQGAERITGQIGARAVELEGPVLRIEGNLDAHESTLSVETIVTGRLRITRSIVDEPLTINGALEIDDARVLEDGVLVVRGEAELSLVRVEAHDPPELPRIIVDEGRLTADRSLFAGTILMSTDAGKDGAITLRDSVLTLIDGMGVYGIVAEVLPISFQSEDSSPCPDDLLGSVELSRITVITEAWSEAPDHPNVDAIRVNCTSFLGEDLMLDASASGAGLHLGLLGNRLGGPRVERVMITAFDVIDRDRVGEVRAMLEPPPPAPGIRLSHPPSTLQGAEATTLTITDVSAYGRKRGLHVVQGRQRIELARLATLGNYGNGIHFQRFLGEARMRDVEIEGGTVHGNDSVLFGHGLVADSFFGGNEGAYYLDRFLIHDLEGAAIFLEGFLGPVELSHGMITDNRIGVLDAFGEERTTFSLTEVRFESNELTLESGPQ